jgi:hypothetical protein
MKNNKNRTIKKRIQVDGMKNILGDTENQLIAKIIGLPPKNLNPKISIQFSRITLADNDYNERLTIDTDLSVKNGKNSVIFDKLVISEIKHKVKGVSSVVLEMYNLFEILTDEGPAL